MHPNALIPHGTLIQRTIATAELKAGRTGKPYIFMTLEEGGIATLGPFDYYGICKELDLITPEQKAKIEQVDTRYPYALWNYLPDPREDLSFLEGHYVEFKVERKILDEGTPDARDVQTFRFKKVLGKAPKTKWKTIRAVVEVRVPNSVPERALVRKLEEALQWPLQLGIAGDKRTLVKPKFKSYSRVRAAERPTQEDEFAYDGAGRIGQD